MQAEQVLHKLSEGTAAGRRARRRQALEAAVAAAPNEQRLTVTGLGRA